MAAMKRIPTPMTQHLRRFRLQALPVLVFVGLVISVSILWDTHHGGSAGGWISGEVHARAINIYSTYDGILMPVTLARSAEPDMLAQVDKGDVVARIDPRIMNEEISSLKSEIDSLKSELQAASAELELDLKELDDDRIALVRRLSLDVHRMELDVLDRKTELAADRSELARSESEFRRAEIVSADSDNTYLLDTRRHMVDYYRGQVEGNEKSLAAAETQLENTRTRLGQMLAGRSVDIRTETVLAPLRHQINAKMALVRGLEIKRDMLDIASPISGSIIAVHCQPGQAVRSGDLLMTVSTNFSDEVVAYVRESQLVNFAKGQNVLIRPRFNRGKTVSGVIQRIGSSVMPIPERQLRKVDQPEWGIPVCISIDAASGLTPGELLDITATK